MKYFYCFKTLEADGYYSGIAEVEYIIDDNTKLEKFKKYVVNIEFGWEQDPNDCDLITLIRLE